MMNPTAALTELGDSAKEELKERLGYDGTPGFLVYRRLPSFIPIFLSSIFFVLGLISPNFTGFLTKLLKQRGDFSVP